MVHHIYNHQWWCINLQASHFQLLQYPLAEVPWNFTTHIKCIFCCYFYIFWLKKLCGLSTRRNYNFFLFSFLFCYHTEFAIDMIISAFFPKWEKLLCTQHQAHKLYLCSSIVLCTVLCNQDTSSWQCHRVEYSWFLFYFSHFSL